MKRRVPSFLAGVLTTLLAVAMATTALAASGAISYNGATVTVGGEAQAAGDITTAEGQAPGSIQFTDAAGNVTHYLPLETIGQLPGVDAVYDPATKTVKLERVPVWVKQEETENGMVSYVCDAPDEMYTTPPDWAITQVPEGWTLESVGNFGGNSQNYDYRNGSGRLTFTCSYPSDGSFGWGAGYPEALDTCRTVMVNGYEADLYFYNDRAMLAWEDKDGLLFFFTADEMDPDTLVEVASSVAPASDAVPNYEAGWLPEGYSLFETNTSAGTVETTWIGRGGNITLTHKNGNAKALAVLPNKFCIAQGFFPPQLVVKMRGRYGDGQRILKLQHQMQQRYGISAPGNRANDRIPRGKHMGMTNKIQQLTVHCASTPDPRR